MVKSVSRRLHLTLMLRLSELETLIIKNLKEDINSNLLLYDLSELKKISKNKQQKVSIIERIFKTPQYNNYF